MPRDVTITFDDDTTAVYKNVPEGVTPEQVTQRAAGEFAGKTIKSLDGGKGGGVLDTLKGLGADLVRGGGKAATFLAEGAAAFNDTQSAFKGAPRKYNEATALVDKALPTPQDDSKGRQYLRAGLEGVGGGLVTGGISPVAALSAAGGGMSTLGATDLLGDNALSKLVGGLAGGLAVGSAASRLSGVRPQSATLAKEAIEGIPKNHLEEAAKFQKQLAEQNIRIDLAQALEAVGSPSSNLTTIRNFLANKKQGTQVQEVLRNQPGELEGAASSTVARMPGKVVDPSQAANTLQETATNTLEAAKKARSAAVRPLYEKAGDVDDFARKELIEIAKKHMTAPGATEEIKASAKSFIDKMNGKVAGDNAVAKAREALAKATTPSQRAAAQKALADANATLAAKVQTPVKAADVDTWIGEAIGPYKGTPLSPTNPKALGQLKYMGKELNEWFQVASPEVAKAERVFRSITEKTVNPLKQSAVGQIATRSGYKPDVQATSARFTAMLEQGIDPSAKSSSVASLGHALAKQNPQAFADALKSHVSLRIQQAIKPGGTAAATANNPDMASKIASKLWGNAAQWEGLQQATAVAAGTMGTSPKAAVQGLRNLMKLTKAMESRPGAVGGLQPQDILELSGRNYGADSLRIFGFLPFERAARRLEDRVMGKTLEQFDKILTTPEGIELLEKLGKTPIVSKKAMILLANFGTQAARQSPVDESVTE